MEEKQYHYKDLNENDYIYLDSLINDKPCTFQEKDQNLENYDLIDKQVVVLYRLLRSKHLLNISITVKNLIILLLLHSGTLTKNQIKFLGLYDCSSSEVIIRSKLAQMSKIESNEDKKRNYLVSDYVCNKSSNKYYFLSSYGYATAINMLPQIYLEKNNIKSEPRNISCGNLQHDLGVNDLFYILLGDQDFIHFRWYNPCMLVFDQPILDNISRALSPKGARVLRPDALICNLELLESFIFVEQDMLTERIGTLQDKINSYAQYLSRNPYVNLTRSAILFHFSTFIERVNSIDPNDEIIMKYGVALIAVSKIMRDYDLGNIYEVKQKLHVLIKDSKTNKNRTAYTKYQRTLAILNYVTEKCGEPSDYDDLKKKLERIRDLYREKISKGVTKQKSRQYCNRYNQIRAIIENDNELFGIAYVIRLGLSLICSNNNAFHINHKYCLLSFHMEIRQTLIRKLKKIVTINLTEIRLQAYTVNYRYDEIVFPNTIMNPNIKHKAIVIENISEDMGGYFRIKVLIENYTSIKENMIFILIVNDILIARQINKLAKNNANKINIVFYGYDELCEDEFFLLDYDETIRKINV